MQKAEFLGGKKRICSSHMPRQHYQADAVVVWCFDKRCQNALLNFLGEKGLRAEDLIQAAGGLQPLTSPEKKEYREFMLMQVQASIALHKSPVVYLMAHSDCGKYGGLEKFGGNEDREFEYLMNEMDKAEQHLRPNLPPTVKIAKVFGDPEGVWQV